MIFGDLGQLFGRVGKGGKSTEAETQNPKHQIPRTNVPLWLLVLGIWFLVPGSWNVP
jgi:hypothetical protein